MSEAQQKNLTHALWQIYHRPERSSLWSTTDGNLPWNDPDFARRMLREHLDESHGAASRVETERLMQIDWIWSTCQLRPSMHILDMTCGPGFYAVELARRGCTVTGIDFSPASIEHAQDLADAHGVSAQCDFIEQDVRTIDLDPKRYDAALFIYGQLAVFPREEAQALLRKIAQALKPEGILCVELLNQERVDKAESKWWYTDDTGLWGDAPYLHLGERMWDADAQLSMERFYVLHLETGDFTDILLCDQTYAADEMCAMMQDASFSHVSVYPDWDNLQLYDANEWIVYLATR
ncbi:MAG: class I SAM-dependent methyltransferase [Chloroflexota bacterium]